MVAVISQELMIFPPCCLIFIHLAVVLGLALLPACQGTRPAANAASQGLPLPMALSAEAVGLGARVAGVSYYGPGSERIRKGQLQPVVFPAGEWRVPAGEYGRIYAVASHLQQTAASVLVVGVSNDVGGDFGRALGERRAQAVREKLIGYQIDPDRIQTVSYGADAPGEGRGGLGRAEFGIIVGPKS